jgi:hypothetical protein
MTRSGGVRKKSVGRVAMRKSPAELALHDDLLAWFGTAIELPLRNRVAKALFNKAITLGTLDCGFR